MWKVIEEFPNYMINTEGVVMNKKFQIKSQYTDRYGYKCVTLYKNKKKKNKTIHSLVMETFIMKRPLDMQINHINGKKDQNNIENLEYVTASNNLKHAYSIGLKSALGEKNGKSKLTKAEVKDIKIMLGRKVSQSKIAKFFNLDPSTISNIKTGKLWSHVV